MRGSTVLSMPYSTGKTLQENTKLLSDIGAKQGSRLMVLGRKVCMSRFKLE